MKKLILVIFLLTVCFLPTNLKAVDNSAEFSILRLENSYIVIEWYAANLSIGEITVIINKAVRELALRTNGQLETEILVNSNGIIAGRTKIGMDNPNLGHAQALQRHIHSNYENIVILEIGVFVKG